jgi:hypothetical protein
MYVLITRTDWNSVKTFALIMSSDKIKIMKIGDVMVETSYSFVQLGAE